MYVYDTDEYLATDCTVLTMRWFRSKPTVVGDANDSNYAMEGNASDSTQTMEAALQW